MKAILCVAWIMAASFGCATQAGQAKNARDAELVAKARATSTRSATKITAISQTPSEVAPKVTVIAQVKPAAPVSVIQQRNEEFQLAQAERTKREAEEKARREQQERDGTAPTLITQDDILIAKLNQNIEALNTYAMEYGVDTADYAEYRGAFEVSLNKARQSVGAQDFDKYFKPRLQQAPPPASASAIADAQRIRREDEQRKMEIARLEIEERKARAEEEKAAAAQKMANVAQAQAEAQARATQLAEIQRQREALLAQAREDQRHNESIMAINSASNQLSHQLQQQNMELQQQTWEMRRQTRAMLYGW